MQKWEYCSIVSFSSTSRKAMEMDEVKKVLSEEGVENMEDFVHYCSVKGEEKPSDKIDNLYETIARLGKEGWELVSHTQSFEHFGTLVPISEEFYFKRPLTEK